MKGESRWGTTIWSHWILARLCGCTEETLVEKELAYVATEEPYGYYRRYKVVAWLEEAMTRADRTGQTRLRKEIAESVVQGAPTKRLKDMLTVWEVQNG